MKSLYPRPWNTGLTLIELLLVIALIMVIGATGTPFLSRFLVQNQYETTIDQLISTVRKAQTYSMNNKNNTVWGICYTANKIRLYQGSCTSPTISEDFEVPSTITLAGLNDTTLATTFSLRRGEPSQALTITISANVGTTTITINRAGSMTITGT